MKPTRPASARAVPRALPARAPALGHASLAAALCALGACSDDVRNYYFYDAALPDAGAPAADAAAPAEDADVADDAGEAPAEPDRVGPLTVDTAVADHTLDLFGVPGHRFWLDVSDKELAVMNEARGGGIGIPGGFGAGHYTPDAPGSRTDHLAVRDAASGLVADYGKVGVRLVGESTGSAWTRSTIPNFRFDTDEFVSDQRIGGFEHFRLNNGQVGTIFREVLAHRLYRALGYPALRTNWAFVGGSAWGKKTWVPMALMEVYKQRFCDDNQELLGGTCTNMWEFAGDPGGLGRDGGGGGGIPIDFPVGGGVVPPIVGAGPFPGGGDPAPLAWLPPNACQVKSCDTTRLLDFESALHDTPMGPGFRDALADYIDWPMFQRFQCLSWMLWTGDDMLHNSNNSLMIERDDGKLVWAPYSVDISLGGVSFSGNDAVPDGYTDTPLLSGAGIARGCQADPACWADTIVACEGLIAAFDALDPELLVDEAVSTLSELDMLRDGDDARAARLRTWLVQRQLDLPTELDLYRSLPDEAGTCASATDVACDAYFCNGTPCVCTTRAACESLRCQGATTYCDALARCVTKDETCPTCSTPAAPLYCPPANACVADLAACSTACADQQPGWVYCPELGGCNLSCDIIIGPR